MHDFVPHTLIASFPDIVPRMISCDREVKSVIIAITSLIAILDLWHRSHYNITGILPVKRGEQRSDRIIVGNKIDGVGSVTKTELGAGHNKFGADSSKRRQFANALKVNWARLVDYSSARSFVGRLQEANDE